MVFRETAERNDIDSLEVEILENVAYVQGLQDAKDALIELYMRIRDSNREDILDALVKFTYKLEADINIYRTNLLDHTLFETMAFIHSLFSPKKEEKKAAAQ